MTADQLRQYIMAVPFTPFHVRTADGRRVTVHNRDFILITPPQTHTFVFQPDGSFEVLDIALIPGIEFGPPAGPVSAPAANPDANPNA